MPNRSAAVLLLVLAGAASAADLDHSRWDALLKAYVTLESRVDYGNLREHGLAEVDLYLRELARPWPEGMQPEETKAALINSYDALTVRWILSNYPVKSIWRTEDPFRVARHTLDGNSVSLDQIEGRLRRWLANPQLNELAPENRTARVSLIFNWYARDFEQSGGVRQFLARFAPARDAAFLSNTDAKIEYEKYHWGLNDASPLGSDYSQRTFYWDWARNGYLWPEIKDWFFGLGRKYGVNPIIIGSIYVGAIPFFSPSVAWLIRNIRRRRSPVLPALCASFCLISAYLYLIIYLIIAGKNIPVWVYFFVAGMAGYGAYSTVRTIKNKVRERGA